MKRNRGNLTRMAALALLLALALLTAGCAPKAKVVEQNFEQLSSICELATMKCFYHNVAERESGQNSLFRLGYQKIWIEYSGTVRVGIDASKVSVEPSPDGSDVMIVTLPRAQVLDIDFDEDSIHKVDENHVFSLVNSQKDVDIFNLAQQEMEQTASEDKVMLARAQSRAKKVIERYIRKCGEAVGRDYTIEWRDYDATPQTVPSTAPSPSAQPSESA